MKTAESKETTRIPYGHILVPERGNIRGELDDVEGLANELKDHGQIEPVLVEPNPDPETSPTTPWRLVEGFRRMAAFAFNRWHKKDILATIRVYPKGDNVSRIVDNWAVNRERAPIPEVDLARTLLSLIEGTFDVPPGEEPAPVTKEEIIERFRLTASALRKYLRIVRNVDRGVLDQARRAGLPLRLLIAMSAIEGEGEEKDVRDDDRAEKQEAIVTRYVAEQQRLAEAGRQRRERTDKGKSRKEETAGVLAETKKLGTKDTWSHRPVKDYIQATKLKIEATRGAADRKYLEGIQDTLLFLTGSKVKPPGLLADDLKAVDEEDA